MKTEINRHCKTPPQMTYPVSQYADYTPRRSLLSRYGSE